MKCGMCSKGELEEKIIDYKEFGIVLGRFKAEECNNCKESFFDSETAKKIQEISKEKGLFGLSRRIKVAQVGNSLSIRIPKELAEFVKLKKKEEVKISPRNQHELIIEI
jgi:hypothetical protein